MTQTQALNTSNSIGLGTIVIPGSQQIASPQRTTLEGTNGPDIILGTPGDDDIFGFGGNDTLIGTTGTDVLNGGDGIDTADYSNLGQAIVLLPAGGLGGGGNGSQLNSIETVIAPVGQTNVIDGTNGIPGVSFNIDLATNQGTVNNIPGVGNVTFTVVNFVNIIGTTSSDTLLGNSANNLLDGIAGNDTIAGRGGNDTIIGGLGNDSLSGGSGKDILQGTIRTNIVTSNEQDTLIGGAGQDRFILGDTQGSFYEFGGKNDLAKILDFSFGDQIQLGVGEVYNIQRKPGGFDIFVVQGNIREQIADVRLLNKTGNESLSPDAPSLLFLLPSKNFQVTSGQELSVFVGA
jgi:Ca2+-binding RTX toxin-like protein